MVTYLRGLTVGLAYVAPIGAQNLFVIQTAIGQSRRRAFVTALIVIFFDVTLSLACFFGVGTLMERLPLARQVILAAGGTVIVWIGLGLLRSKADLTGRQDQPRPWSKVILQSCVVTWFNPQAIIDGTMLLGAFRATMTAAQAPQFILGSMSASFLWFLGITAAVSLFRGKITPKLLTWINRICGCVLVFYGAKLLLQLIRSL